jgi:hypothetical protein
VAVVDEGFFVAAGGLAVQARALRQGLDEGATPGGRVGERPRASRQGGDEVVLGDVNADVGVFGRVRLDGFPF